MRFTYCEWFDVSRLRQGNAQEIEQARISQVVEVEFEVDLKAGVAGLQCQRRSGPMSSKYG